MGIGLNIAIGLAGLLDLGYVTNYAVGAYVMAVLTSTGQLGIGGGTLNFWIVVPLCIVVAMFTGFVFAVPVLKMRGDYLAIATLGFGEIIGTLALSDWLRPTLGGAQGILGVPNPNFFGTDLKDPEQLYYIVLIACVITLFVSIRLNNSRIGRQWMAIREDEDVAAAMGIDTARSKLLAFTLSAATGGLAGAIFAAKVSTVFPNSFSVFVSINVLALIIVGGMGSNPGIVLGAIALVGLPELLREFSEFRWLIYGALLIFMMLNRPEGLLPSQVTQRELQKDPEPAPPPEQAAQTPATAIGD
jgi:branched-chain amino acid transport system permease protein